jgi:hypothetical protein
LEHDRAVLRLKGFHRLGPDDIYSMVQPLNVSLRV